MKRQTPINVPKTAESLSIVLWEYVVSISSATSPSTSMGFRIATKTNVLFNYEI
jgi:hypothetical protein